MRDQTESTITHWIHAGLYTLPLVMVETERRWQLHMQMSQDSVQNHLIHQTALWVDFVRITSHQVQQLGSSAGIGNLITVLTEKVALAMESSR